MKNEKVAMPAFNFIYGFNLEIIFHVVNLNILIISNYDKSFYAKHLKFIIKNIKNLLHM